MYLKKIAILILAIGVALIGHTQDNCPSSITFKNPTIAASSCLHNGSIIVNTDETLPGTAIYQILTGPAGFSTTPQSLANFENLAPGNYTIKVSCGSATATTGIITVGGNYTAPSNFVYAFQSCPTGTNFAALTVTSVTGGNSPYEYGYVLSNDPSTPDANFVWSSNATIQLPVNGTYQIRVRDACGGATTRAVIPPAKITFSDLVFTPRTYCSDKLSFSVSYKTSGTTLAPGAMFEVYAGTSAAVTPATGTLVTSGPRYFSSYTGTFQNVAIPPGSTHLYVRVLDPCNNEVLSTVSALPAPGSNVSLSSVTAAMANNSCNPTTDPSQKISFSFSWANNNIPSITNIYVTGYDGPNATGNITIPETDILTLSPQQIGYAKSYKVRVVTPCGEYIKNVAVTIPGPMSVGIVRQEKNYCPVDDNRVRVYLSISGYIPDGTTFKIVKVPDDGSSYTYTLTIPVTPVILPPGNYRMIAENSNGCTAQTGNMDFTVTMQDNKYPYISLDATANSACTDGLASVTIRLKATDLPVGNRQLTLNGVKAGSGKYFYQLPNASTDTTITITNANLSSGQLIPDKYIVKFQGSCTFCCVNPSVSDTVELLASNVLKITKQKAMNCDNGVAASVYLEFAGAVPFTIERKLPTESAYQTVATGITTDHYLDAGLAANTSYDYKISNSCGTAVTTTATTSYLQNFEKLTSINPCAGVAYDLSAENIKDATYSWTFNGNPLSNTTSTIHFDTYNASNDGTYVCTISINGCLVRNLSYTLNSQYCSQPLYALFGNITANISNGELSVNWQILKEVNVDYYQVEVSADGVKFKPLTQIKSKVNGNTENQIEYNATLQAGAVYGSLAALLLLPFFMGGGSFRRRKLEVWLTCVLLSGAMFWACNNKKSDKVIDENNAVYIRIAVVDKDGTVAYSKVIKAIKE